MCFDLVNCIDLYVSVHLEETIGVNLKADFGLRDLSIKWKSGLLVLHRGRSNF